MPVRKRDYARPIGLVVLAIVTAYGLYGLFTGDWATVVADWRGKVLLLAGALALGVLDMAFEGASWMWVCRRFGIRAWDLAGLKVFLSGYAGLLLPMQLGNLIRPDAFKRLDRGSLRQGVLAEAVAFFLDATAALAVLIGVGTLMVHPALSPIAALVVVAAMLTLGDRLGSMVSGTRLELPAAFWWRWQTVGIVALRSTCWIINGVALYVLVRDLPGDVGLVETLFFAPASTVLGSGTGLPGGIGAVEGFLGVSLKIMDVPAAHFAFAVGAFRLATFWIWLPIGWVALVLINRQVARRRSGPQDASTST